MARKLVQYATSTSVVRLASITALALAACAPACSSDSNGSRNDGGLEGGAGTGGQTSTGGSSGKGGAATGGAPASGGAVGSGGNVSTGGVVGTGGVPESGVPDSSVPDSSVPDAEVPDAKTPDAQVPDARVPDAQPPANDGRVPVVTDGGESKGFALAAMTDYRTSTEVAVVDLATGSRLQDLVFADGDAVLATHGNRGFVLERTRSIVHALGAVGAVEHDIDLVKADGGAGVNPHDIVPIPGTSKAYVSLYAANRVAIVDLTTGEVTGNIDLSQFLETDPDGSVEADVGVYDPLTNRVYFALQRLANFGCPTLPSLLVGIDPATDTVVDINGADAGNGVALKLLSPSAFALAGTKLYVLANGCTGDTGRHGVEVVALATGTTTTPYVPTEANFLTGIALTGTDGLINRYTSDFLAVEWKHWPIDSADLGAVLPGTPDGAALETATTLVGIKAATSDAGTVQNFVRYIIGSGATSVLTEAPFTKGFTGIAGVTVVR